MNKVRTVKHVGIVACSSEGAALCYRALCLEAGQQLGQHQHPEISLHHHPLAEYLAYIWADNWPAVAQLMLDSARRLASIGADFVICPDNTIHQAFELVAPRSPIPWLHIAEEVAKAALEQGYGRLALSGTRSLVRSSVYPQALARSGIECQIPESRDIERMDQIIHNELVNGIVTEASRLYFNEVYRRLKKQGCDATVLGCTEIPLLVDPADCPLPTLDSTRLLARAAVQEAISTI